MAELAIPASSSSVRIGALAVGLVLLAAPNLGVATQLLLWAAFSTALVLFWFRYLKPRTMTAVGTSAAQVTGEVGVLVSDLCPNTRPGTFPETSARLRCLECYADTNIKGARVRIVNVEGSFIKVEESNDRHHHHPSCISWPSSSSPSHAVCASCRKAKNGSCSASANTASRSCPDCFIIPYPDSVTRKLTTKDIILDAGAVGVITCDNAVIVVNAIAFIKITDPVKAVYGAELL